MSPHLQTSDGKLDFSNDFYLLYLIYFSTVSTVFVKKKNIFYSSIYISISLGLLHEICLYWFFMRKMFIFSLQLSLKSCKSWNKPLKYLNWTNCSQSVSEVRNYILKYLNWTNCSQSVSEVRNYILQYLSEPTVPSPFLKIGTIFYNIYLNQLFPVCFWR